MKQPTIRDIHACFQKRCVSLGVALALLILTGLPLIGAIPAGQQVVMQPFRTPDFPLPGRLASRTALAKGRFLVASRGLRDPNFSQTVILLLDYHRRGAMGLIINWPTETRLAVVLPDVEGLRQRQDTVYIGGPVARDRMLMLIRSSNPPENSRQVIEDVYVSSNRKALQHMVDKAEAGEHFRVYAGYAGWAPGQLEHEVARGDWHIMTAKAEIIFDMGPAKIWPELIRKSSVRWLSF